MVVVHAFQCQRQRIQRFGIPAVRIQVFADGDVGTRNLIQIVVLAEFPQRQPPQPHGKQRIDRNPQLRQGIRTAVLEERIVVRSHHQVGKPLHPVAFKVRIPLPRCQPPRGVQLVKLAQPAFIRRLAFTQCRRAFDVVVVQQLVGVCRQFLILGNLVDGGNGFRPLLQIIIVDGRDNMKFRTGVVQAHPFMLVHKKVVLLGNPFHAAQGAVAIVVELLVQGGSLVNLHQPDIGNQQFQFVLGTVIHLLMILFRLLEVHAHEGAKAQMVGSLRPSLPVVVDLPVSA